MDNDRKLTHVGALIVVIILCALMVRIQHDANEVPAEEEITVIPADSVVAGQVKTFEKQTKTEVIEEPTYTSERPADRKLREKRESDFLAAEVEKHMRQNGWDISREYPYWPLVYFDEWFDAQRGIVSGVIRNTGTEDFGTIEIIYQGYDYRGNSVIDLKEKRQQLRAGEQFEYQMSYGKLKNGSVVGPIIKGGGIIGDPRKHPEKYFEMYGK